MKITKAIPAHLQGEYLSDQQREELKKFKERAMTAEELQAHLEDQERSMAKQAEREKQEQRNEILKQLSEIDEKSIRALRTNDTARLEELEKQAAELRKTLE